MTEIVIKIDDEKRIDPFLQMLKLFDFVIDVDLKSDKRKTEAQRERTLNFAGSWSDIPDSDWEELQQHFQRRNDFFPQRDIFGKVEIAGY